MVIQTNQSLKSISLFSGCGGLDGGVHAAGFIPLATCEIDPNASQTLEYWLRQQRIHAPVFADAMQLESRVLLDQFDLRAGDLDLMFGGSPCQSYSLAGKRKSLEDERGELLFEIPRLARVMQPKVILMEQVKGLLSAPGYEGERGGAFNELIQKLEEIGYLVNFKVLNAADYGVPQVRQRLFVVAAQQKFMFPEPTHTSSPTDSLFGLKPYMTVWDAIRDLPEPTLKGEPELIPSHVDITPARDRERIHGVPEGDYLARQFHLPKDQRCNLDPKKDTTKFRRLSGQEPSLTLRGGEAPYHPIQDRYITPREAMRLHGFPDSHILLGPIRGRSGSYTSLDQHRLVGNAVPPPLAKALATAIRTQMFTTPPATTPVFAVPPSATRLVPGLS